MVGEPCGRPIRFEPTTFLVLRLCVGLLKCMLAVCQTRPLRDRHFSNEQQELSLKNMRIPVWRQNTFHGFSNLNDVIEQKAGTCPIQLSVSCMGDADGQVSSGGDEEDDQNLGQKQGEDNDIVALDWQLSCGGWSRRRDS